MSKRMYELDVDDIGTMVGLYMRTKYPEVADMPGDTDVTIRFSARKKTIIVEIEL